MPQVSARSRLDTWRDVIFALFIRELQSKFNDKLGFTWAFIEPALFILMLSFLRGRLSGSDVHGVPVFVFMMIGLIYIQSFSNTWNSVTQSIHRNKPLYAFRQVHPISSLVAQLVIEALVKVGVVFLLILFMYVAGIEGQLENPLLAIALLFLIFLSATSLGLLFAVGEAFVPELSKVRAVLNRPLFFISGVFYSLQDIPQEYWVYLNWNPILHAIELTRFAAYPAYGSAGVSIQFLVMFTLVSVFFALACYQITWKKVLSR